MTSEEYLQENVTGVINSALGMINKLKKQVSGKLSLNSDEFKDYIKDPKFKKFQAAAESGNLKRIQKEAKNITNHPVAAEGIGILVFVMFVIIKKIALSTRAMSVVIDTMAELSGGYISPYLLIWAIIQLIADFAPALLIKIFTNSKASLRELRDKVTELEKSTGWGRINASIEIIVRWIAMILIIADLTLAGVLLSWEVGITLVFVSSLYALIRAGYRILITLMNKKELSQTEGEIPMIQDRVLLEIMILQEAEGWGGRPKGWKQSSMKKFAKSLTGKKGTEKGFFDKCVEKMKGKVANPEGFCAGAKDELHGSTYWRGKGKSPQEAGKDVKKHKNVNVG
jgi:hypothetical protein